MKPKLVIALLVVSVFLSFAHVAAAGTPYPPPVITIKIQGLACNAGWGALGVFAVGGFTFGASTQTSPAGVGTGMPLTKPGILPLSATKQWDECSSALFGAAVSGVHFPQVDLVQLDGMSRPVLSISLADVFIVLYQVGTSQASTPPQESIQLNFSKVISFTRP